MTAQQELAPTSPDQTSQLAIAHYGGFRYDHARNSAALGYIAESGRAVVEPLPDPTGSAVNTYTVKVGDEERGGEVRTISAWAARKYAGNQALRHSLSDFQAGRAVELNRHHEAFGHEQVDAIFQSADALMGLQAVCEKPEAYRNVILAYPAGIAPLEKISKASVAVAKSGLALKRAERMLRPENDYERHLRTGVTRRGIADRVIASSVALSYQAPLLHEIRSSEGAPGVSMILGTDDEMMRPDKVIKGLVAASDVDFILVTDTAHGFNGRKDVMDEALKLLDKTEQSRIDGQSTVASTPLTGRILFYGNISEAKRTELLALAAEVDARPGPSLGLSGATGRDRPMA